MPGLGNYFCFASSCALQPEQCVQCYLPWPYSQSLRLPPGRYSHSSMQCLGGCRHAPACQTSNWHLDTKLTMLLYIGRQQMCCCWSYCCCFMQVRTSCHCTMCKSSVGKGDVVFLLTTLTLHASQVQFCQLACHWLRTCCTAFTCTLYLQHQSCMLCKHKWCQVHAYHRKA